MPESSAARFRHERSRQLAEIKSRTRYRRNLLFAALPGIVLGLALIAVRPPLGLLAALIGGAAGPGLYHWWLWYRASTAAKRTVMQAWAAEHGWTYRPTLDPPVDVAFCRNRQKPRYEDGFEGPIAELPGLIFNFTFSTYETRTRTDSNGNVETYQEEVKHHHTVLRLELGDLGVRSLQLSPQGLGGGFAEKLRSAFTSSRAVDLESAEFNDRFTLLVEDSADAVVVRRIFEPAFIMGCIEGRFPLAVFQYERPAVSFLWDDSYDVEELEEVEQRVAAATPMAEALAAVTKRLALELGRP
jgi:hypothetical protein